MTENLFLQDQAVSFHRPYPASLTALHEKQPEQGIFYRQDGTPFLKLWMKNACDVKIVIGQDTYILLEVERNLWEVTLEQEKFAAIYGEEKCQSDQGLFEDFYANEFNAARDICGFNPASAETVHKLKECGYRVALATNPIFPHVATENRIRWAGLVPEDFEIYTTYEASTFCKPNPAYYLEVARTLGVKPEECLMVGNDATEDMAAREVGMDVFLLTDCLINAKNRDLNAYPRGDFAALNAYIDALQ